MTFGWNVTLEAGGILFWTLLFFRMEVICLVFLGSIIRSESVEFSLDTGGSEMVDSSMGSWCEQGWLAWCNVCMRVDRVC